MNFKKKNKSKNLREKSKKKKKDTLESLYSFSDGREMVFSGFKSKIFLLLPIQGIGHPSNLALCLKILTSKQMLQRLPIAPAQVKASNTSENLLNEICQITYSLY